MGLALFGVAIGCGLVTCGAAYGIGRLASAAVESMARQPAAAGDIRGAAIVLAAFIEGFTFFALVVALLATLAVTKANWEERPTMVRGVSTEAVKAH